MPITTVGLVIREVEYGENGSMLTILTPEYGKISVGAHGVKSIKSKNMAATRPLCYSEFVISERGDRKYLRESSLIEHFYKVRTDPEKLAVALYLCETANDICTENSDESQMLSLVLNTLFMLSESDKPTGQLKAVYEMRAATAAGFMPDLSACSGCGAVDGAMYLDVMNGCLVCDKCLFERKSDEGDARLREEPESPILFLEDETLSALRYIVSAPAKRIFSFCISDKAMTNLCEVCEKYFVNQLGRSFKTLDFYRDISQNDIIRNKTSRDGSKG